MLEFKDGAGLTVITAKTVSSKVSGYEPGPTNDGSKCVLSGFTPEPWISANAPRGVISNGIGAASKHTGVSSILTVMFTKVMSLEMTRGQLAPIP